jgi:hypothetical protein
MIYIKRALAGYRDVYSCNGLADMIESTMRKRKTMCLGSCLHKRLM